VGDNLPIAIPMTVAQHIAERAEGAFKGSLRACMLAFPDYTVAQLEQALALATYRVAMQRLQEAPQELSEAKPAGGAPETENAAYHPCRPVFTGPSEADPTEEREALADGSGPVDMANGRKP
jgi:hypothetical protein